MAKNGESPRPKPNVNHPVDLSRIETWSYALIWVGSCFYAIYTVLRYSLGKSYKFTKLQFSSSKWNVFLNFFMILSFRPWTILERSNIWRGLANYWKEKGRSTHDFVPLLAFSMKHTGQSALESIHNNPWGERTNSSILKTQLIIIASNEK